ncbi:MAG TPA: hypothetical protein VHV26_04875 [Rhizomicrobium sp.]|jgi:hypothetical protein|nr:hypothetical protein [Rhizomicrobium sp.]
MKITWTMMFALTTALALPAVAQTPPPAGGGMGGGGGRLAACRDDSAKYCSDKRGPDRRACLNDNKDKLSDACKAALSPAPAGGGMGGQ